MDSIMAKGAGKAKGVRARLEGLTGVFKRLVEQHAELRVLLKRLQDDPDRMADVWPEIRRDLMSHERAEMKEVYPLLRDHPQTRALADHHDEEAAEIERLVAEIDAADDDWRPIYIRLIGAVTRHASEEDEIIYPKAQRALGEKLAKELDERYIAAQQRFATVA
jgi:hemerythrin superfamily protein